MAYTPTLEQARQLTDAGRWLPIYRECLAEAWVALEEATA